MCNKGEIWNSDRQRSVEEEPFFGERGSVLRSGRKNHEFPGHHTPYHQPASLPACLIAKYHTLYYLPFKKVGNGNRKVLFFIPHSAGIYMCSGSTEYKWARKPPEEQKKYGELPWSRKNSASRGKYQLHVWTRSAAARHYLSTTLCFKERTCTHANTPSTMLFFMVLNKKENSVYAMMRQAFRIFSFCVAYRRSTVTLD